MTIRKFTAQLRQGSINVGCIQEQGAREYQEDTVGFTEIPAGGTADKFLSAVADGMGGMASGGFVSDYTVRNLLASDVNSPQELCEAVRRISGEIAAGGSRGGTTLAAVCVLSDGVYFCSVGDSRIYHLRGGIMTQLTADADYMSVLLERVISRELSFAQAAADPECDSLSQYVGSGTLLSPDMNFVPMDIQPGDRLLICSDGVYNALSDDELRQSLTLSAGGAAEDILGRIMARGYANQDNYTAVVMQFGQNWQDVPPVTPAPSDETPIYVESARYSGAGGRNMNEDSLYNGGGIYAAADGLGGHHGGSAASAAAVGYLAEHTDGDFSPDGVNELLEGANDAVCGSGGLSALAAAFVRDGVFTCGNVGDCRVYFFRNGKIIYQSRDHSVCQASVELGEMSREDIRSSEDRSGLLKALGAGKPLDLRQRCEPIALRPGDGFLVCTDGFWQSVYEHEMETDLIKSWSAAEWLNSMLKRHLLRSHDGGDNYTAVCGVVRTGTAPAESVKSPKKRFPVRLLISLGAAAAAVAGLIVVLLWLLNWI